MKSILEQLYVGEIYPAEKSMPKSREYRESCNALSEDIKALKETHTDMEKELESVLNRYSRVCALEIEDMFYYGFRLGVKLMAEALCG